jgi:hypothetical protein
LPTGVALCLCVLISISLAAPGNIRLSNLGKDFSFLVIGGTTSERSKPETIEGAKEVEGALRFLKIRVNLGIGSW